MGLSAFIRQHEQPIMKNWEDFARHHIPPAKGLDRQALRDHLKGILNFIADDLDRPQTEGEQIDKSKGQGIKAGGADDSAAEAHADVRFVEGFEAVHIVAEFRALRASVIRLWECERSCTEETLNEMVRFNEAVDQVLAEALARYTDQQTRSHNLFLGMLVHDLRNPLAAVSQSAQLLKIMGKLDEKQEALVDQINTSTLRAIQLVGNLIDVVRVKLGKGVPIMPASMDMKNAVHRAADEVRAAHPGLDIQVETGGDLKGKWDNGRIGQLLSNLIGNAVQHGKQGSAIRISAQGKPREIVLSIHNEGEPIPKEALTTIFDPLTRQSGEENPEKASTSLGLGLFITKEIVEAHGGKIEVSSSEEEGTIFLVTLPHVAKHTAPL